MTDDIKKQEDLVENKNNKMLLHATSIIFDAQSNFKFCPTRNYSYKSSKQMIWKTLALLKSECFSYLFFQKCDKLIKKWIVFKVTKSHNYFLNSALQNTTQLNFIALLNTLFAENISYNKAEATFLFQSWDIAYNFLRIFL